MLQLYRHFRPIISGLANTQTFVSIKNRSIFAIRAISSTHHLRVSDDREYYVHNLHGRAPRLRVVEKRKQAERRFEDFKADDLQSPDIREAELFPEEIAELKSAQLNFGPAPDDLFKSIDIEVRGHDPAVLKSYLTFALSAAGHLDLNITKTWAPREILWHRTLLKSVHVHKKARVQYATKTFFQCFRIVRITGSTASTFLEYLQRNLPEGVAMKVTKREVVRLPEFLTKSADL